MKPSKVDQTVALRCVPNTFLELLFQPQCTKRFRNPTESVLGHGRNADKTPVPRSAKFWRETFSWQDWERHGVHVRVLRSRLVACHHFNHLSRCDGQVTTLTEWPLRVSPTSERFRSYSVHLNIGLLTVFNGLKNRSSLQHLEPGLKSHDCWGSWIIVGLFADAAFQTEDLLGTKLVRIGTICYPRGGTLKRLSSCSKPIWGFLLLNFSENETASILEPVLVGATDIKKWSPVPLSLVQKNGAARRVEDSEGMGIQVQSQIPTSDLEPNQKSGAKAAALKNHFELPFVFDDIVLTCFNSAVRISSAGLQQLQRNAAKEMLLYYNKSLGMPWIRVDQLTLKREQWFDMIWYGVFGTFG